MFDQRDRMIEKQAEIISKQNAEIGGFREKYMKLQARYDEIRPYADFYKKLQETILSNPTLINEWQSFMLVVRMVDPDQEKYRHDIF